VKVAIATKRAEIVAEDQQIAARFRSYLEGLEYSVRVKTAVEPTDTFDVDIVVYHVSPDAAKAERRSAVRRGVKLFQKPTRFWLEVVQFLSEHAPAVPILVSVPAGGDAADKALDSGATDVIEETVTPKVFRRRVEMIEALQHGSMSVLPVSRPRAQLRTLVGRGILNVPLPELRSAESGRIDSRRVAEYLDVPLRRLADAIQVKYPSLHKTPDGLRVQERLGAIVRILELADLALGSKERVRIWLNRPLHELEDESPLATILAGESGAVETLLENARLGIPG
jgi:hypothetical protein